MATIANIKPDQVLYTVTPQKIGNTTLRRKALHEVKVVSIDPEGRFVVASWNHNAPRKFYESSVSKWKVNKPEPKGKILGMDTY